MRSKTSDKKIVVIVGPTASGKSALGVKIARKLNGEIISADSRQVYKGMDVGTGKVLRDKTLPVPNLKFKIKNSKFRNHFYSSGIRHHLLDVVSPINPPNGGFAVAHYKKLTEKAIEDIASRGKLPIIVGGTGLYIDAVIYDLNFPEVPPNKKLRRQLENKSAEQLFSQLQKLDPQRAKTVESKNKRRLIRAIEIAEAIGHSPVLNTKYYQLKPKYDVKWIGIKVSPEKLKKKIKSRLDKRLKQGMVGEVQKLLKQGITHKRLREFGLEYRWLSKYLKKEVDYKTMKEKLALDIFHYAKRQMTWFNRNKNIKWRASS